MEAQKGYFYILTNKGNNVFYAGSTKNLAQRVKDHRKGYKRGFTQKYNICRLVCYETFARLDQAQKRERQVKGWTRKRKIGLIESANKEWKDLYDELQMRSFASLRMSEAYEKNF